MPRTYFDGDSGEFRTFRTWSDSSDDDDYDPIDGYAPKGWTSSRHGIGPMCGPIGGRPDCKCKACKQGRMRTQREAELRKQDLVVETMVDVPRNVFEWSSDDIDYEIFGQSYHDGIPWDNEAEVLRIYASLDAKLRKHMFEWLHFKWDDERDEYFARRILGQNPEGLRFTGIYDRVRTISDDELRRYTDPGLVRTFKLLRMLVNAQLDKSKKILESIHTSQAAKLPETESLETWPDYPAVWPAEEERQGAKMTLRMLKYQRAIKNEMGRVWTAVYREIRSVYAFHQKWTSIKADIIAAALKPNRVARLVESHGLDILDEM